MLIVGIDMAKSKFDVGLWVNHKGETVGQFTNDDSGYDSMKKDIRQQFPEVEEIKLIIEPTGGYEMGLILYALNQDWQVSLPNPKIIKDWAKGSGWRAKTDKQDAMMLAQYGVEKNPPCYQPLSASMQEFDDLITRQEELKKLLRSERNRLKQYEQRPRQNGRVIKSLEKVIETLEEELSAVEDEAKNFIKQDQKLKLMHKRLLTIPGVGPVLVNHLLILLTHWSLRTNNEGTTKQLVAFAGLDPQPFESGHSVYKRPTISKMGDKLIRNKLYMGALGGVRGENVLADFYKRLVGRGKAKRLALVAASRKILVWSWAIFVNEVDFDATKAAPKSV
jgi:transposase